LEYDGVGFDVEIHVNLTSQGMNNVKRKMTEEGKHKDANCFLMLIIRFHYPTSLTN